MAVNPFKATQNNSNQENYEVAPHDDSGGSDVVDVVRCFSAARIRITEALLIPHSSEVWAMLYPSRYIWTMRASRR